MAALSWIRGVFEESSRTVTFTLKDQAGVVVPLADIDTITLTLYDFGTYSGTVTSPSRGIINGRIDQDVKNTNDVTVHATTGLVTWVMQPDDNVIVVKRRLVERHFAEFHIETTGGAVLNYPFGIEVVNLRKAA